MQGRCEEVKKAGTRVTRQGLRRTGWEAGCLILHDKQLSEQDSLAPRRGERSLAPLTWHPGDQFSVSDTSKLILIAEQLLTRSLLATAPTLRCFCRLLPSVLHFASSLLW